MLRWTAIIRDCLRNMRSSAINTRILIWIVLLLSSTASAHESRPSLLKLVDLGEGRWQAEFKQPQVNGRFLNLKVESNCRFVEGSMVAGISALQEKFELICEDGDLSTIEIVGLDRTLIDTLVTLELLDGSINSHLISSNNTTLLLDKQNHSVPAYLILGIEHLLFGVDHVLFLLVLLYIVVGWVNLLKVITSFTVAHSITLGLSAFNLVTLSAAPVEALIALSIIFLCIESLKGKGGLIRSQPWVVTFMFGLLHGLGFASALAAIGLPQMNAVLALFLFNVGIEIGQLLIVCVALALVYFVRHIRLPLEQQVTVIPLYVIGSVASYWFIDRTLQILA
ncbi:MAG: HupE / UreJ protein [Gammaproteobacteria bacterium]|nr:HupE / UreJ protein [Gammaproteobacteria bacterium]